VRGHAGTETLAAFREGLLSRRKTGRVSAHVAGCPQCAALDAQLAEVTALLSRSSAPPMPGALTVRIKAALVAEAAARSVVAPAAVRANGAGAATPGAAGRGAAPGAAGRVPAGRSPLVLRAAAVTAAVAIIVGGGYGVARLLSPGNSSQTSSHSGAATATPSTLPQIFNGGASTPAKGPAPSERAHRCPRGPQQHQLPAGPAGRTGQRRAHRTGIEQATKPGPGPGPHPPAEPGPGQPVLWPSDCGDLAHPRQLKPENCL
jgi:hypothetical protein